MKRSTVAEDLSGLASRMSTGEMGVSPVVSRDSVLNGPSDDPETWAAMAASAAAVNTMPELDAGLGLGPPGLQRQTSLENFDLDLSKRSLYTHMQQQQERNLVRQKSGHELSRRLQTFASLTEDVKDTFELDLGLAPPVPLTRSRGTGTDTPGPLPPGKETPVPSMLGLDQPALGAEEKSRGEKRSFTAAEESAPPPPVAAPAATAATAATSGEAAAKSSNDFDFFDWDPDRADADAEDSGASRAVSGGLSNHSYKKRKKSATNLDGPAASLSDSESEEDMNAESYRSLERQRNSKHLRGLYTITSYLGHGAYGHVYAATCKRTGDKVAIKRIVGVWDDLTNAKRLLRELRILRELNQSNIIEMRHILEPIPSINNFKDLWIVFEHADTDLRQLMQSNQYFSTLHVQYFLYQLLLGTHFMHTAQIIHRDLKPANILANGDCNLKICDFGLARGAHLMACATSAHHPFLAVEQEDSGTSPGLAPAGASGAATQPFTPMPSKAKASSAAGAGFSHGAPPLIRQLTKHVQTRWYRAPELILMANDYTSAIDMWSVGCILAELLGMQKESEHNYRRRQALFPGRSCFPLSGADMQYKDKMDQLNVIFSVIGTPSQEDIKGCPKESHVYLKNLPPKRPEKLKERYPGADPQALDMLNHMLAFNPKKRMTAKQALEHPFLASMRDSTMEAKHTSEPIDFEFEDIALTEAQIKALIQAEVVHFNPQLMDDIPHSSVELLARMSTPCGERVPT